MAFLFRLVREDGTPGDPPSLQAAVLVVEEAGSKSGEQARRGVAWSIGEHF